MNVMSGDEAIHSSIAKSSPRDLLLITLLGTIKCSYIWKKSIVCACTFLQRLKLML